MPFLLQFCLLEKTNDQRYDKRSRMMDWRRKLSILFSWRGFGEEIKGRRERKIRMWDDEKVGLVKIYAEMELGVGEWIGRGKRPPSAQSPGRHGRMLPLDGYIWASSLFSSGIGGAGSKRN